MSLRKLFIVPLLFLCKALAAQEPTLPPVTDSTFGFFWDSSLSVSVHIFNPDEPDNRSKNALLTVRQQRSGSARILFRDSVYMSALKYRLADMDGDGQKDLLLFRQYENGTNRSYHLYLVGQRNGALLKVRNFEQVLNPAFYNTDCSILGYRLTANKLVVVNYIVNQKGILCFLQ